MQGLPKHTREPGDILGVADHASLEDLRAAYVEAKARAKRGNALDRLSDAPHAPAGLGDIEWAYKELLARFMVGQDADEDSAVSAVLLPGLTPESIAEAAVQSNVLPFTSPALRKDSDAPKAVALSEDEDDTVLPFHGGHLGLSESEGNLPPEDHDGIPELREALARAAAPFARPPSAKTPARKDSTREVPRSASLVAPPLRAPSHKPWIRGPAAPAHEGSLRRAAPSHPTPAPSRMATPPRKDPGLDARSILEGLTAGAGDPPRTIRTVIGGEEREVVNIVARASHREDIQELVKGLLSGAEVLGGPLLRSLRCAMGVEEAEICARIRLAQAQLVALEEDAFDKLPAPVYYRGFVVSYLKYLGLERPDLADALTENYRAQLRARYFRGNR